MIDHRKDCGSSLSSDTTFCYGDIGDDLFSASLRAYNVPNAADYWAASEKRAFEEAFRRITENRTSWFNGVLLDAGTGLGRMIELMSEFLDYEEFCDLFSHNRPSGKPLYIGFDPDRERIAGAVQKSLDVQSFDYQLVNGNHLVLDALKDSPSLIISSHVIQHISHHETLEYLRSLSDFLVYGGYLLLTTCLSPADSDSFEVAFRNPQTSRDVLLSPVTEVEFDLLSISQMYSRGTILPIRSFSLETLKECLTSLGLRIELAWQFHVLDRQLDGEQPDHDVTYERDLLINLGRAITTYGNQRRISHGIDVLVLAQKDYR